MIERIETEITRRCDVLVCGGGFAGIAAALAAARQGKKVLLLEKQFQLGGLGTAGLVTIYLPLCDGCGRQVSFGIAEELLRLSVSMGAEADEPACWLGDGTAEERKKKRFDVRYNPHLFALLAEELLCREGVELLYGSYAVAVHKEGDRIDAVIVENKSGRQAIAATSVVDATGDCDIARFAEAPTALFAQGNVLAAWYYALDRAGYDLKMLGYADLPEEEKTASYRPELLTGRRFTGVDGDELSLMTRLSHASTLRDLRRRRQTDPTVVPTAIATTPQVRMSRKLVGAYTLDESETHTRFDDSVGMVSSWKKSGPVFEVPFRTLYSATVKNLLVAGRCTSVTDRMWDIMRVIPCCAVTGQAAGTAAALSDDMTTLPLPLLQAALKKNGVVLHESDLPAAK